MACAVSNYHLINPRVLILLEANTVTISGANITTEIINASLRKFNVVLIVAWYIQANSFVPRYTPYKTIKILPAGIGKYDGTDLAHSYMFVREPDLVIKASFFKYHFHLPGVVVIRI